MRSLARASHFGYEQASLEIFWEFISCLSLLNIFLYYTLLFTTVKELVKNKSFGVMAEYKNLYYNSHDTIFFIVRARPMATQIFSNAVEGDTPGRTPLTIEVYIVLEKW